MKPGQVYKEGTDYYLVLEVRDEDITAVRWEYSDTFDVTKAWSDKYWRLSDDGQDHRVDGEQG